MLQPALLADCLLATCYSLPVRLSCLLLPAAYPLLPARCCQPVRVEVGVLGFSC